MSTKSNSIGRSLPRLSDRPFLEAVAGTDKGKIYDISGERLTIGRSDNNDIVVASEAISRYHAVLERSADGQFFVKDNQSKNGVQVNGQTVGELALRDGDIVQVGTFIFKFNDPTAPPPEALANSQELAPYSPDAMPVSKLRNGPNKRLMMYGALGLFLAGAWYLSNGSAPSTPADTTAKSAETSAAGQTAVPASNEKGEPAKQAALEQPKFENPAPDSNLPGLKDPTLTRAEQQTEKLDLNNNGLKEAEQYFRKGQREYLNKNYHRAIDNFQAALSLNRGHELAEYYLRLAVYEVESEAKKNFEIGIKYFESMQYSRAIYHFSEAESLMSHRPADKMIGDSEKYILQAKRRLQAAEQFP